MQKNGGTKKLNGTKMYQEYRITELVNETIITVIDNVQKNHDLLKKSNEKNQKIDEIKGYEQLGIELEEEYLKNLQISDDEFELARTHWIQLQKSNKQGLVIRSCFLSMLENYPQIRPIWGFGKNVYDVKNENWKSDLVENFYFRHHCASIQAALSMIIKNKDDKNSLRKILNEMGGHHFFYDSLEPHLQIFEESFLESMRLVLNGGDCLDEETEQSWIMLLQTIRLHMGEGIEHQRNNYLHQCLIPKEMDEIRNIWIKIIDYGFINAGTLLCESACQKYIELLRQYNLTMPLPSATQKGTKQFDELSIQLIKALDKTIESYNPEKGFFNLTTNIHDFFIKFLVIDVCPPLIRRAFIDGLVHMLCTILKVQHVKEDFVHIWGKLYRVMEQAMISNIIEY